MCEAENPEGETHLLDMLVLWTQICDSKLDEKRCQIHHLTAVVVQVQQVRYPLIVTM